VCIGVHPRPVKISVIRGLSASIRVASQSLDPRQSASREQSIDPAFVGVNPRRVTKVCIGVHPRPVKISVIRGPGASREAVDPRSPRVNPRPERQA